MCSDLWNNDSVSTIHVANIPHSKSDRKRDINITENIEQFDEPHQCISSRK